jgi:diguanylate cyclase (GGDEF)-like protein
MERSGLGRASHTALTVLAVGPAIAMLAVARALPAVDLGTSDLGWVLVAAALAVATAATAGGIVLLVSGLRDGSAASIAAAGASAALAGGAVGHLADGQLDVPLAGAATALLAAAVLHRGEVTLGARSVRVWAALAAVAIAEGLVLTELLPDLAAGVDSVRPVIIGVAVVIVLAASAIALGGRLELAAIGLSVGVIGVALDRGDGLELVIGMVVLAASQLGIAVRSIVATPALLQTPQPGPDALPRLAHRLADAVLQFDGRLRLRDWNPTAESLLGLDAASAGARLEDLLGVSLAHLPTGDGAIQQTSGIGGLQITLERFDSGVTAIIRDPGTSPETERLGRELRGTIEELLQARRTVELQRQELERASTIDPLTGVGSRAAILDRVAVEIAQARRYQHPVAIVMLDVDGFSEINRRHGTEGGDAVLREVALRIRLRVREADALGRVGSDSFLAVLPHTDESGAATFADALQHRLGLRRVAIGAVEEAVTISVGVAVMRPGEDLDVDGLLDRADEALTSARGAGGDRIALDRLHGLARLEDRRRREISPDGGEPEEAGA